MTSTPATARAAWKNRYGFGLGTLGRDAVYTLMSMFLIFYLTDVVDVTRSVLVSVTTVIVVTRILDAVADPFVGVLIDNTRSRWGKFKPWITAGALAAAVLLVLLFSDFQLAGAAYIVFFSVVYIGWSVAYTANDVGYWSMLPSLTRDQAERERIGSFARIMANVGTFTMVVAIVPVTQMLAGSSHLKMGYLRLAVIVAVAMVVFQMLMVWLVREDDSIAPPHHRTRFRDLLTVIFKNDQLLWVAVSMVLFFIAYNTTVGLGLYYFKYVFGDEDAYSVFAAILGVAQIGALIAFPSLARRMSRTRLFTLAMGLVTAGYVLFFVAPTSTMLVIGVAGLLLFIGHAFIQILILMFITDTVEYGQWKLGKRNESVTLSLQPFIYKLTGAIGNAMVTVTVIAAHIQEASGPEDLTTADVTVFKLLMMIVPLVLIGLSYVVYRRFYRLDEAFYGRVIGELREREEAREA